MGGGGDHLHRPLLKYASGQMMHLLREKMFRGELHADHGNLEFFTIKINI